MQMSPFIYLFFPWLIISTFGARQQEEEEEEEEEKREALINYGGENLTSSEPHWQLIVTPVCK